MNTHTRTGRPIAAVDRIVIKNINGINEMVDKQMSILVVDDFASMRTQIKEILKDMKFNRLFEARDGNEAVSVLSTRKIDFIISDWNMPDYDGIELLRYVRSHEIYRDIPFLMITAVADRNNILEAVAAKVSNYIVKPFTSDTLELKIRGIFGCTEPLWEE